MIRMPNFKGDHNVEEPPSDAELKRIMAGYELAHQELYLPFSECATCCRTCNRRTRNQAESFVAQTISGPRADVYQKVFSNSDRSQLDKLRKSTTLCGVSMLVAKKEAARIAERYGGVGSQFGACVYIHMLHLAGEQMRTCKGGPGAKCGCTSQSHMDYLEKYRSIGEGGQ